MKKSPSSEAAPKIALGSSFMATVSVLSLAACLLTTQVSRADDSEPVNESKAKLDTGAGNKVPGAEAVDDMITNNNLRALSGSTSKWSFASQWNYLGGTLGAPLNEDRPNIAGSSATTNKTDIDGTLNIKYNIDVQNSLLTGFGVRWIAPFKAGGPTNYSGTTYDAINPSVTYQHIYKLGGLQSVLQVSGMQYTQADSVSQGFAQNFAIDQENMYEIGKTGISIGGSVGVGYNTFTNDDADLATAQSVYQFWLLPYAEYALTSTINLRTVCNLLYYEHYKSGDLIHDVVTESVGVGFSVTRDIFLYPNVQFLPSQVASVYTNVGVAATINLF